MITQEKYVYHISYITQQMKTKYFHMKQVIVTEQVFLCTKQIMYFPRFPGTRVVWGFNPRITDMGKAWRNQVDAGNLEKLF